MKKFKATGYWVLVAAFLFAPLSRADVAATLPRPIVLKAAHLFDAVSGQLLDHGMVVVTGTKIQAVGSDLKVPENAQIVDLGDATLMPGFIDAHVHLSSESSANWYQDWFYGVMRFPAVDGD